MSDLHQLCGLLSVAFDACVEVRETPRPREWGALSVPTSPLPWQHELSLGEGEEWPSVPMNGDEMPTWLAGAWQILTAKPWLAHALSMHHEGLQIEWDHPTLALVTYVSAIEALAVRLLEPERCPTCNAYTNVRQRFERTLRLVLTEENAQRLNRVYPDRSKTVHAGRLHGTEAIPLALQAPFHHAGTDFQFGTVMQMRLASAGLLIRALQDDLP